MTNVKLDWDAQKWKAPHYLMEDRAFDGVVGVGAAAAGGTVGALTLGRAINAIVSRSFVLTFLRNITCTVASTYSERRTPRLSYHQHLVLRCRLSCQQ